MERSLHSQYHQVLIAELKRVRLKKGLTQQALADRLTLPQSYIAKIETGERGLDVIELLDLVDALGERVSDILDVVIQAREN